MPRTFLLKSLFCLIYVLFDNFVEELNVVQMKKMFILFFLIPVCSLLTVIEYLFLFYNMILVVSNKLLNLIERKRINSLLILHH